MSVNLAYKGKVWLLFKMSQIQADAEKAMHEFAPAPGKASPNKYNMSTGNLQSHISSHRTGLWSFEVVADTPYAQYADKGRGVVRAKNVPYLVWKGGDGRIHRTKTVGPMKGWEFVEKTKNYLISKWG